MKTHHIHLHTEPFLMVKSGEKKVECRINDEKRRTFRVGDTLLFESRADGEVLTATIAGLRVCSTFEELFGEYSAEFFGGKSIEELVQNIRQFYTEEDEKKWGVVGIEFVLKK